MAGSKSTHEIQLKVSEATIKKVADDIRKSLEQGARAGAKKLSEETRAAIKVIREEAKGVERSLKHALSLHDQSKIFARMSGAMRAFRIQTDKLKSQAPREYAEALERVVKAYAQFAAAKGIPDITVDTEIAPMLKKLSDAAPKIVEQQKDIEGKRVAVVNKAEMEVARLRMESGKRWVAENRKNLKTMEAEEKALVEKRKALEAKVAALEKSKEWGWLKKRAKRMGSYADAMGEDDIAVGVTSKESEKAQKLWAQYQAIQGGISNVAREEDKLRGNIEKTNSLIKMRESLVEGFGIAMAEMSEKAASRQKDSDKKRVASAEKADSRILKSGKITFEKLLQEQRKGQRHLRHGILVGDKPTGMTLRGVGGKFDIVSESGEIQKALGKLPFPTAKKQAREFTEELVKQGKVALSTAAAIEKTVVASSKTKSQATKKQLSEEEEAKRKAVIEERKKANEEGRIHKEAQERKTRDTKKAAEKRKSIEVATAKSTERDLVKIGKAMSGRIRELAAKGGTDDKAVRTTIKAIKGHLNDYNQYLKRLRQEQLIDPDRQVKLFNKMKNRANDALISLQKRARLSDSAFRKLGGTLTVVAKKYLPDIGKEAKKAISEAERATRKWEGRLSRISDIRRQKFATLGVAQARGQMSPSDHVAARVKHLEREYRLLDRTVGRLQGKNLGKVFTNAQLALVATHKDLVRARQAMAAFGAETKRTKTQARGLRSGLLGVGGRLRTFMYLVPGVASAVFLLRRGLRSLGEHVTKFDEQLGQIHTLLPVSRREIDKMGDAIEGLAKRIGRSPVDMAEGLYYSVSAGFRDTADALLVLEASSKVATAGLASTEETVDALTSVLNAYGMGADAARHTTNLFFKTVEQGKIRFRDLAQDIGVVTATSAQNKVAIEELLTAYAGLTAQGIRSAEAAISLERLIAAIASPKPGMEKTAAAYGIPIGPAALQESGLLGWLDMVREKIGDNEEAMNELFDAARIRRAAFPIVTNMEKFERIFATMTDGADAADLALQKVNDTILMQFNILTNKLKIAFDNILEQAIGIGLAIADWVFPDDLLTKIEEARATAGGGLVGRETDLRVRGLHDLPGAIAALEKAGERLSEFELPNVPELVREAAGAVNVDMAVRQYGEGAQEVFDEQVMGTNLDELNERILTLNQRIRESESELGTWKTALNLTERDLLKVGTLSEKAFVGPSGISNPDDDRVRVAVAEYARRMGAEASSVWETVRSAVRRAIMLEVEQDDAREASMAWFEMAEAFKDIFQLRGDVLEKEKGAGAAEVGDDEKAPAEMFEVTMRGVRLMTDEVIAAFTEQIERIREANRAVALAVTDDDMKKATREYIRITDEARKALARWISELDETERAALLRRMKYDIDEGKLRLRDVQMTGEDYDPQSLAGEFFNTLMELVLPVSPAETVDTVRGMPMPSFEERVRIGMGSGMLFDEEEFRKWWDENREQIEHYIRRNPVLVVTEAVVPDLEEFKPEMLQAYKDYLDSFKMDLEEGEALDISKIMAPEDLGPMMGLEKYREVWREFLIWLEKKNRQTAKDVADTWRKSVDAVADLAKGLVDVLKGMGLIDRQAEKTLDGLLRMAKAMGDMGAAQAAGTLSFASAAGPIAAALAGVGLIVGSIVNANRLANEHRKQLRDQMRKLGEAIDSLKDAVLANITPGTVEQLLGTVEGPFEEFMANAPSWAQSGGLDFWEAQLGDEWVNAFRELAKAAGLWDDVMSDGELTAEEIRTVLDHIRDMNFGVFGEDLEGQLQALQYLFQVLGDDALTAAERMRKFIEVIEDFSPVAAGMLRGKSAADQRKLLQEWGKILAEGGDALDGLLDVLGLTAEELRKLVDAGLGTMDEVDKTSKSVQIARSITEIQAVEVIAWLQEIAFTLRDIRDVMEAKAFMLGMAEAGTGMAESAATEMSEGAESIVIDRSIRASFGDISIGLDPDEASAQWFFSLLAEHVTRHGIWPTGEGGIS